MRHRDSYNTEESHCRVVLCQSRNLISTPSITVILTLNPSITVILTLNPSITVILTLNAVKGKNLVALRAGSGRNLEISQSSRLLRNDRVSLT